MEIAVALSRVASEYKELVQTFGGEEKLEAFGVLRAAARMGKDEVYLDQLPHRLHELSETPRTAEAPVLIELISSNRMDPAAKAELVRETVKAAPETAFQAEPGRKLSHATGCSR